MIGDKIRKIRRIKNCTQKELGKVLGFTESQMSHIEHGNRKVTIDNVKVIAEFFSVPYEYFFGENNQYKKLYDNQQVVDDTTNLIINDFKKFAIKSIYDNQNNSQVDGLER